VKPEWLFQAIPSIDAVQNQTMFIKNALEL
jgi:hypothetical protein